MTSPRPAPARPPAAVRVLSALVLVQAVALLGVAVALVVGLVRGTSLPGPVAFMAVLALGVAALLAGAARALLGGHRWGRAPVLTVQILLVVLAVGWLGSGVAAWFVVVLVLAVVTAVLVVVPPVVAWTAGGAGERR
ncbi:hypothetical protein [Cellulomonas hominis]|uniref:hypothetical protein n=1 Tax=Cellulomonas hominis TaxID=156981 RepID=UPI0027E12E53|nr:hypothetical protein [Cellulomonas hominis]